MRQQVAAREKRRMCGRTTGKQNESSVGETSISYVPMWTAWCRRFRNYVKEKELEVVCFTRRMLNKDTGLRSMGWGKYTWKNGDGEIIMTQTSEGSRWSFLQLVSGQGKKLSLEYIYIYKGMLKDLDTWKFIN